MSTTTAHYVRYLLPGVIVPEESVREITDRDPGEAARSAPEDAYAFMFYSRTRSQAPGGEVLHGSPRGESGVFFLGGDCLGEADLEAMGAGYATLLANMRGNGWLAVVRCPAGNFQPMRDGDQILRPAP